MRIPFFLLSTAAVAVILQTTGVSLAGESHAPLPAAKPKEPVRTAVRRGLEIVQTAAGNYPEHRQCFSCHHQTLPLLAMTSAKRAGIPIDDSLRQEVVRFTRKSFAGRKSRLKRGTGIGGRAMTVGYGLWTLDIAGEKPDDLSAAMVTYLLKTQHKHGRWAPPSHRPPMEESRITCTLLAVYAMGNLADESQRAAVKRARETGVKWLLSTKPESTEDHVMKLWALSLLGEQKDDVAVARDAVLQLQGDDGGWAQEPGMQSDAYATGQALYVLLKTRQPRESPPIRRAVRFLLKTQCEDGSWFVKTRSRPVQVFFDNGDPHGKSQFISVPATGWATAALAEFVAAR